MRTPCLKTKVIIPHNGTFSDNGQNFANVAQERINFQHSTHTMSVHTKFELDCVNNFSDNGWKPSISVILWSPEGQNLANKAQSKSVNQF